MNKQEMHEQAKLHRLVESDDYEKQRKKRANTHSDDSSSQDAEEPKEDNADE